MHRDQVKIYKIFVGKPNGKRILGRPTHIWQDYTKSVVREVR
jgi:hypothetical protein